jgi:hypothetical protein
MSLCNSPTTVRQKTAGSKEAFQSQIEMVRYPIASEASVRKSLLVPTAPQSLFGTFSFILHKKNRKAKIWKLDIGGESANFAKIVIFGKLQKGLMAKTTPSVTQPSDCPAPRSLHCLRHTTHPHFSENSFQHNTENG